MHFVSLSSGRVLEDKKQKIRDGNETTLMGAMRDNTQMALAMPAISDKK